ncbi:MAG: HAMP domain-containing histidine kinase [Polyangiaceae bacterium]|nr:HAMP domain-containing histidine kinase [Polyangiaceae bacterium]
MTKGGAPVSRPSDPGRPATASTAIVALETTSPDDPSDRWLVLLRWVAVGGMAATILAADRFAEGLPITALMSVLLGIAATNLIWLALTARSGRRYVEAQLAADVLGLGAMLWFAGGVINPFAAFLTFQIAIAGLLCTPRATLFIAGLTIATAAVLTAAPPLPPLSGTVASVATVVSITSLSAILAAFVAIYARRLSRLRAESARNEKLAVLGRLVGSMSHELNTPLATILLVSRELEQFRATMGEEEVAQMVASIAREAERANDIVGLVRGHVSPDQAPEEIELGAFVESHARAELDRLGFQGEQRFQVEGPVVATVIPRALVQILVNLLRNACEAPVIGRKKRIIVGVAARDGRAEVAVEDRGPGFDPGILGRLGEPFQTTKEDRGGMGLGLYVSAMLAKQMGAELAVESLQGGGARVRVRIPLDAAPEEEEEGQEPVEEAGRPSSDAP